MGRCWQLQRRISQGGERALALSLVMTDRQHPCLGGNMVVATWLMDFSSRLRVFTSLKETALAPSS